MRVLIRLPLQLYRMGFGWLVGAAPLIVLTTRGHKTGLARHTVLEYRQHGSKIYAISAWGERAHWYQNAVAYPIVTVQKGRQTLRARASAVTNPAEVARALHLFRRKSRITGMLLTHMSSVDTLDWWMLVDVAGEFIVVRFDLETVAPELPGVHPVNQWIGPALLMGMMAMLLGWVVSRLNDTQGTSE